MSPALFGSEKNGIRKCGVKVLIAAGGSGGHIFPAIALARALKAKNKEVGILFVGSDKALDRRIFEKEGEAFELLSANKLPYRASLGMIPVFFRLLSDIWKSFFIILKHSPDVVVGFGGYVSFPVIVVAALTGTPRIVHEQNVAPGRANKLLFGLADRIAISFDETRQYLGGDTLKIVFTGNPIRREMFRDDRSYGARRFGLDMNKFTILVIGGSQGASFLNRTFVDAMAAMSEATRSSLQVIHITGVKDYDWAIASYEDVGIDYRVHSFIDRIEEAYSAADLVVTRSGSSAIFELAYLGRPMILIPYPFAMSHQIENALAFSKNGAAIEMAEKSLSAEKIGRMVEDLLSDRPKLASLGEAARRMAVPEASELLAEEVMKLYRRKR